MPVDVVDNSRQAISRARDAGYKAIDATANHLQREVVKAFGSDYYKGGRFRSTLQVKQSINRTFPYRRAFGWESQVGTRFIEALYWELGHHNIFTRKYERVRIWEPTAMKELSAMRQTYGRVFTRYMTRA